MLNPTTLVDAIVAALKTIPDLVTAMDGNSANIYGHSFFAGTDQSIQMAVYKMTSPSILVVWAGTMGGNFDASTVWKDRVDIYVRGQNATNQDSPVSYEDLFWLIMNSPINSTNPQYKLNLRNVEIIPGSWTLMDMPSASMRTDETGVDYLVINMVIPQLGDE